MKVTTKMTSNNSLKSFINKVKTLESYKAEAGFYSEQKHPPSGLSMANIATILHEGVQGKDGSAWRIPPRPFLYKAWIASILTLSDDVCKAARDYLYGKSTIKSVMKTLADKLAERITVSISGGGDIPFDNNITPKDKIMANAPSTINQKGFNYPLIESGLLVSSVKSKIAKKKGV